MLLSLRWQLLVAFWNRLLLLDNGCSCTKIASERLGSFARNATQLSESHRQQATQSQPELPRAMALCAFVLGRLVDMVSGNASTATASMLRKNVQVLLLPTPESCCGSLSELRTLINRLQGERS